MWLLRGSEWARRKTIKNLDENESENRKFEFLFPSSSLALSLREEEKSSEIY
jgi:hypothetical protein